MFCFFFFFKVCVKYIHKLLYARSIFGKDTGQYCSGWVGDVPFLVPLRMPA